MEWVSASTFFTWFFMFMIHDCSANIDQEEGEFHCVIVIFKPSSNHRGLREVAMRNL